MKIKKIICAAAAAAVAMSSAAFAMPTAQFDDGMRKGINYYDRGMYYEARDELQWFADYNWGTLNVSQRSYLLGYLDDAKAKVKEIENENSRLTQQQFDNGMKKGINYFNKGMYYEARDEFQWFCDANWGKMNSGQRQYALDYLDGTKAKINSLINKVVGRYTHTTEPNLQTLDITYYDGKTISFSIGSVNSRGTRMAFYSSTEPINNGVCDFYYEDSRGNEGEGTLEIKGNTIVLSLATYHYICPGYIDDDYSIEFASGTYVRSGDL